jgi:hypothetical protein
VNLCDTRPRDHTKKHERLRSVLRGEVMKPHMMLSIALCCGCTSNDLLPLTVSGEGFASGPVHVAVTQTAINESVACESDSVVDGTFRIDFGRVIQPKVGHRVDTFVDLDGNQRCEFGVDAVMSMTIEPKTAGYNVGFPNGGTRVGEDPTGCIGFGGLSFLVKASGVSTGFVRYALVRTNRDGTAIDKVISTGWGTAENGVATIDLAGAAQRGFAYRIDFFEVNVLDAPCTTATAVYRVWRSAEGEDEPFACRPTNGPAEITGSVTDDDFLAGDCTGFSR